MNSNEYQRPSGAPKTIERKDGIGFNAKTLTYYFDCVAPTGDLIYKAQKKDTVYHLLLVKEV